MVCGPQQACTYEDSPSSVLAFHREGQKGRKKGEKQSKKAPEEQMDDNEEKK